MFARGDARRWRCVWESAEIFSESIIRKTCTFLIDNVNTSSSTGSRTMRWSWLKKKLLTRQKNLVTFPELYTGKEEEGGKKREIFCIIKITISDTIDRQPWHSEKMIILIARERRECGIGVSEVLSSKVITLCSSSNFNNWPFECSLEFDKLRLHSISAQYSRAHSIDMQSGKEEDELIMINPST